MTARAPPLARRALYLRGTVQGVGLRPAVYRLARAHELAGFVRNDFDEAVIEIEGAPDSVDRFLQRFREAPPPGVHLVDVLTVELEPLGASGFRVALSRSREREHSHAKLGSIPPDLAPCDECLREMNDPEDRRFRYSFLSCVRCGPRLSVVERLPYDRANTTLRTFPLCVDCAYEYGDARDRRFHAETISCPTCGPTLSLVQAGETAAEGQAALDTAVRLLRSGAIVALKGVAGFALACDATREDAVATLRSRKRRPHKPFAVMARDLEHAAGIAALDEGAAELLCSSARPIVLLRSQRGGPLAANIAPGLADVGVFLPPTPLQQLLLAEGPPLQVMTSGNVSEEPLAIDDDDALRRLGDIADAFLLHDRRIVTRADDSVLRMMAGGATPIRRARGFVPTALPLPRRGPTVLALGGEMKSTLCLARDGRALLSPHLGNLRQPDAYRLFREAALELLRDERSSAVVAHDLHPDYRSTRFAEDLGLPRIAVQHHHAHVASCLVEHERSGPVLALVFDGTGYGDDGGLWGGEALVADLAGYRRVGHLRPLALLGGERAIREPWRLALAALHDAEEPLVGPNALVDERRVQTAAVLLQRVTRAPRATGAGRWFDAVAALCGLADDLSYDGQAAAELEALAGDQAASPYEVSLAGSGGGVEPGGEPFEVDLRPAVRALASDRRRGVAVDVIAARFHETLADAASRMALHARELGAPALVALSGGCFQNRRLAERTRALLEERGFEVLLHRRVPPNDGGLSLGQAAVALARLTREDGALCASASPAR